MSLKDWINRQFGNAGASAPGEEGGLNLAVAALLVEVLRADYDVAAPEQMQVLESVSRLLGLDADASAALVREAEQRIDRSHDLYQFTSQINREYSEADKLRLLEWLWRIARSDETVHKYEEHLIRRVADLLHVPHSGFIAAKLRAAETPRSR
ncbi:MAG TPA: TerB family tellurite resistance protein [Steroidobacteraceae bacterium]|nr:TerB family tellurite resistance protein [Steroidobacteraceae bacterium]